MGTVLSLFDGLRNLVSGVGTAKDKGAGWSHLYVPMTQAELEQFYVSDWLARKIVDIIPYDMTREWRTWSAKQAEDLMQAERRLHLRAKVCEAKTLARLYGGAAILIGDGSPDPREPLDMERFRRDGIKYLHVFNCYEITPQETVVDIDSPDYGKPLFYRIDTLAQVSQAMRPVVHRSRFAFFTGAPAPKNVLNVSPSNWGLPILENVRDAILNVSGVAANATSLTHEAKVDVIEIPDLGQHLSTTEGTSRLIERMTLANTMKSTINTLLLGGGEKFNRNSTSFAGLPELIRTNIELAAGAADIPVTRLFGQSPAGLNATGESDIRNYYDAIKSRQAVELGDEIAVLDDAVIRHVIGSRPDDVTYEWEPLWQMNEKDRAEIDNKKSLTVTAYVNSGLFTTEELRPSVSDMLIDDGLFPSLDQHLDDEAFEAQQDEPPEVEDPNAVATTETGRRGRPNLRLVSGDASPKSLYVRRDVTNGEEVLRWARKQGLGNLLDVSDLHVTIAYSRTPVDWFKASGWGAPKSLEIVGGPRMMERFGDALVVLFKSEDLEWRWQEFKSLGASWDFSEYNPHITIAISNTLASDVDLSKIEPYDGRILLGPEVFEQIEDEEVGDEVIVPFDKDPWAAQPRVPAGSSKGGEFASKTGGGLGGGLQVKMKKGSSGANVEAIKRGLRALPEEHFQLLHANGLEVVSQDTVKNGRVEVAGLFHMPNTTPRITIANSTNGRVLADPVKTTAHEFGHALDHASFGKMADGKIMSSLSSSMESHVIKSAANMTSDERKRAAYYLSNKSEMFAELYALKYGAGQMAFAMSTDRANTVFRGALDELETTMESYKRTRGVSR